MENFIDSKQLAEALGLKPVTIRRWAKNKEIPYIKVGKRGIRFSLPQVTKWLQDQQPDGGEQWN